MKTFCKYCFFVFITFAFLFGVASEGRSAGLQKVRFIPNPATDCDAGEFGQFGGAIALGDLNGDGLDDLVVLRTTTNFRKDNRAAIYYSQGGASPFSNSPVILERSEGTSITIADVNADGKKDLIIVNSTGVDVFYGKASHIDSAATPDWSFYDGTRMFTDVSIMDGNADGIDDVLIGAGGNNKAYVFYGSPSGLPSDHLYDAIIEGSDVLGWGSQTEGGIVYKYWIKGVGAAVSPDGKFCSSGVCVGKQYVTGAPNSGIDLNNNNSISPNEDNIGLAMVGPRYQFLSCDKQSYTFCGYALGNAGDVNGDGQTDLIVSAKGKTIVSGILPAKVFVYLGKDPSFFGRMNTEYSWSVTAGTPVTWTFGSKVGSAGDINGDGYGDIFITEPRYDTTNSGRSQSDVGYWGRVNFWFGGPPSAGDPTGLGLNPTPETADLILNGEAISGEYGAAVAVGDINGDGYSDVVVGDPRGGASCYDRDLRKSRFAEMGLVWVYLSTYAPPINRCSGDFDNDGDVDGSDLAVFSREFGRTDCGPANPCKGDFDHDGDVDGSDLAVFSRNFGRTDCR